MKSPGLKQERHPKRWIHAIGVLAVGASLLVPLAYTEASAATMYSYIDEHGTPVFTNDFNTIPERYRAKVKTTEAISTAPQKSSHANAVNEQLSGWVGQLRTKVSSTVPVIAGLSSSQSEILTFAGFAAVILLAAMTLSKGQGIRLLALWGLIMLGIGTPVLMYVSDDGPMDVLKNKASQVEKQRQDRVNQIP